MFHFADAKLSVIEAASAADTDDNVDSASVDMSGYDSVVFFTTFGAITDTGTAVWKIQQSSDDGSADTFADLTGTGISLDASDDGDSVVTEIIHPKEWYLRVRVVRATANVVIGEIYALQYNARRKPQTSAVADGVYVESHYSPAEGTA